jgi:hypothetical protein
MYNTASCPSPIATPPPPTELPRRPAPMQRWPPRTQGRRPALHPFPLQSRHAVASLPHRGPAIVEWVCPPPNTHARPPPSSHARSPARAHRRKVPLPNRPEITLHVSDELDTAKTEVHLQVPKEARFDLHCPPPPDSSSTALCAQPDSSSRYYFSAPLS